MILYDLRCKSGHQFEAWFRDSAAYDKQRKAGVLSCPTCGDKKVEKALMAPAVASGAGRAAAPADPAPPASPSPEQQKLAQAMRFFRELRKHVESHCDYVGPQFAEEARRIHYKEAEPRGIYGEASEAESKAL